MSQDRLSGALNSNSDQTNSEEISSHSTASTIQPLSVIHFIPPDRSHSMRVASELPSRKFQFSLWHDLRENEVYGNNLKAPRVRKGPAERDQTFYLMVDEDDNKIHHDLHGRQKDKHRNKLENWEEAKLANFPSQELQHSYQRSNLGRILGRLKHVTYVNLRDNALIDLSSFTFPCCEYLNLDSNYLTSFEQLPSVRNVHYLTLKDNNIASYSGIRKITSAPLEELYLQGNPIAFEIGYRQKIFIALPNLKFLDGVAKQKEDTEPPPPTTQQQSCAIS